MRYLGLVLRPRFGYKALVLPIETRYCGTAPVKQPSSKRTSEPQPSPRRRRRAVEYLVILVGSVLMIDGFVGDKGLLAMMEAREQYRLLEESLAAARAENARLRAQARRLREDPAAIEEIARRELGLIRPGEKLFIIRDIESREHR